MAQMPFEPEMPGSLNEQEVTPPAFRIRELLRCFMLSIQRLVRYLRAQAMDRAYRDQHSNIEDILRETRALVAQGDQMMETITNVEDAVHHIGASQNPLLRMMVTQLNETTIDNLLTVIAQVDGAVEATLDDDEMEEGEAEL